MSAIANEALAYVDALHNLAPHLTGNSVDAEDLVKETYVRAFRAERQFTPGNNLKVEIGDVLGCPVATVKSRLSRARGTLRLKLKDYAR